MDGHRASAEQLRASLDLASPPVAIAFRNEVPPGVPRFDGMVPAGCRFWEEATTRTFVTSAADHALCSIGIYTHNLADAPASQEAELKATLEAMTGLDYVRGDEVAAIPVVAQQSKHVVYGPLAEFPVEPDVVLLFANAEQGLVLSEATERIDGATPPAMGRPACAVVPQVLGGMNAAVSLGCCGARAYLDLLTDSVALWALPGRRLAEYREQIAVLARANDVLTDFHVQRRRDVESGEHPSVPESLAKLG
ncbi:MAG: DUF169 domain-containing protein [Myxococcota bacterium]|nr:DUF169 domain-containing protein [Myxococcota bacterium]